MADPTALLAAIAIESSSASEFRRHALTWLWRRVDYDAALFVELEGDGEPLEAAGLLDLAPAWPARLHAAVVHDRAALVTSNAWRTLDVDGLEVIAAPLIVAGEPIAAIAIARVGGAAPFTREELAPLVLALPVLTLGLAVHAGRRRRRTLPAPGAALSPREREIVDLLVDGRSNAEIAAVLGTSVHTVRNQLAAIFRKTGVNTRTALVAMVLRGGLVRSD